MRQREREALKLMTSRWARSQISIEEWDECVLKRAVSIDAISLICLEFEQFSSIHLTVLLLDFAIG